MPEGIGSPWHVHPEEDEWFYVLEGEITFWVADTRLSLKAGSFGFGPKGVPHTFYAEAGGAERWSASRRCSSRDSRETSASPPPSASCRHRPRATRTSHGSHRSPSETGSRSSARPAPHPDTQPSKTEEWVHPRCERADSEP